MKFVTSNTADLVHDLFCCDLPIIMAYLCSADVWGNKQDERGAYLIDRSPEYFEPILNYLRHGQLIINEGINLLGKYGIYR